MSLAPSLSFRALKGSYTCRSCLLFFSWTSRRQISSIGASHRKKPVSKLPAGPARTRFAPSPTGYLHLGSLRTALFNYLLAKKTGGTFILRIEDTDRKRTIPDAEQRLFEDLTWAGIKWDEGPEYGGPYGPYKQSERTPHYVEHANKLLDSGHAYRCFCTAERLASLAEQRARLGLPTDYDRTCSDIPRGESDQRATNGESYVIRLRVPDNYPTFTDLVYGVVGKTAKPGRRGDEAYEDPILLKSDGLPTYHLANVVDDHLMQITHVIRGTEWLSSTPKHLAMYEAFNWEPPAFAHVGLLVDEHGNKLSKRNFDTDVASFRDKQGVFPEALANFVALLGWSHMQKSDVMTIHELIDNFTMKFTKGNATVNLGKLWFLQNKHAVKRVETGGPQLEEMIDMVQNIIEQSKGQAEYRRMLHGRSLRDYLTLILKEDARNFVTADEFLVRNSYFLISAFDEERWNEEQITSTAGQKPKSEALDSLAQNLYSSIKSLSVDDWNTNNINAQVQACISAGTSFLSVNKDAAREFTSLETPNPKALQKSMNATAYSLLRQFLALGRPGPSTTHIMEILGKEESIKRMEASHYWGFSFRDNQSKIS